MAINALKIHAKDNVVVVIEPVAAGEEITFRAGEEACSLVARAAVPIYHKAAAAPIAAGQPVVKYGEHIGVAACDIAPGDYVHTHNIVSVRENLDERIGELS